MNYHEKIWSEIQKATSERNTAKLHLLKEMAERADKIKAAEKLLIQDLEKFLAQDAPLNPTVNWELTQGDLNQNILKLTQAKKKGFFSGEGQMARISTENQGFEFESEVDLRHNKLRERGLVGKLYRNLGALEGDQLSLEKTGPGEFMLHHSRE